MRQCVVYICILLAFIACEDPIEDCEKGLADLCIEVTKMPLVKGQQSGIYLPDGAEVGLFVCAEDGSDYEGKGYANVKYRASGIEAAQQWSTDPAKPVGLTRTKGVCYAYYPWQGVGVSLETIPITNDGTDWMYTATPATNLSNQSPTAQLNLVHAMTIIRCVVKKGPYNGSGVVHTAGVQGAGLATGASLNLLDSELTALSGVGEWIQKEAVGTLGAEPIVVDLWAVPTGVSGSLFFELKIDDRTYRLQTPEVNPAAGSVYTYSLTVEGEELALSAAEVSEWVSSDALGLGPGLDLSDYALDWEVAKATDGVYAITAEGKALLYEYATENDFVGVAFVVFGKAYQVAKYHALNSDGASDVYFWKEGYGNIATLKDYRDAHEYREIVKIPWADGSYQNANEVYNVDGDYRKWVTFDEKCVALTDFDGKSNTANIIEAQKVDGVLLENTCGISVVSFRSDVERSEGQDDWFIPSVGQLAYMYIMNVELNDLLNRIGAEAFRNQIYLTSTECQANSIFYVYFNRSGYVRPYYKYSAYAMRLIREIE